MNGLEVRPFEGRRRSKLYSESVSSLPTYESSRSTPFCFGRRRGGEWVVGPVMLWIAAAKFFAHILVRVHPEAGQVLRDLDWSFCR